MRKVLLPVLLLLSCSYLFPQPDTPETRPRYVFFSYIERGETEQRINEYAAVGYRLVGLQANLSDVFVVMLEDVSDRAEARYEYKLVEGLWEDTRRNRWPLIDQLQALGGEGYRVFRGSLLFMHPDGWACDLNERALAMEREVGTTARFEYRESAAILMGNTRKDMQAALADGFEPLLYWSQPAQHIALFERARGEENQKSRIQSSTQMSASGSMFEGADVSVKNDDALVVRSVAPKKIKEKFAADLTSGMRIVALSSYGEPARLEALIGKNPSSQPMQLLVTETKSAKSAFASGQAAHWENVARDLNEMAAKGYAISIRPVVLNAGNSDRFVAPMEPLPSGSKRQYHVVQAYSLPDLSEQVNEAADAGWRVVPSLLYGSQVVILQREVAP